MAVPELLHSHEPGNTVAARIHRRSVARLDRPKGRLARLQQCCFVYALGVLLLLDRATLACAKAAPPLTRSAQKLAEAQARALVALPNNEGKAVSAAVHILNPVPSNTPEALKAEIIAAEAALALRAEVDGPPAVYDSPSVSISLRRVSPNALVESETKLETPNGAGITLPADPRIKGRHGGPVTISVTSYHTGDKVKEVPTVKYGANRQVRRMTGGDGGTVQKEDRVDFFMTKTSVSWRGTVNVKVPGLAAQVPAHDRPWAPFGEKGESLYPGEKAELRTEVEALAALGEDEKRRGLRRLSQKWHPDKRPEDLERATEVFAYLQELRQSIMPLNP